MKKIQITLIQIDNYGPWTVTPAPRKESELQLLQAELFGELERRFGELGALVFPTRFDNMVGITNGVSVKKHREIQEAIARKFPVTISMGIGAAQTAYDAQVNATLALQAAGGSQSSGRKNVLVGEPVEEPDEDWVQIAHMDINHSTLFTDTKPIYDTHFLIQRTYLELMKLLLRRRALVFYTGGDNFMAAANGLKPEELASIFAEIKRELGVELKAGVGGAPLAEEAARRASERLHEIRKMGRDKSPIRADP
jgi:GTP cyclohydrolase IIa